MGPPLMYQYCGVPLSTDIAIPELRRVNGALSGLLHYRSTPCRDVGASSWDHEWKTASGATLRVARISRGRVLQFEDDVEFVIDTRNGVMECTSAVNASVRHQLLDQVLPRVLCDSQGFLMVHSSAVLTEHGAVIFVGESGRGKSTLAGSFHQAGQTLLTDDCLRVEIESRGRVTCTPTYPSLRLWPDSADDLMRDAAYEAVNDSSTKRRFPVVESSAGSGPFPVAGILSLATPGEFGSSGVLPVDGSAMLTAFISQCFRLDPTAGDVTRRIFEETTAVIGAVRTGELRYPRDHDQLPLVREEVLRWLADA